MIDPFDKARGFIIEDPTPPTCSDCAMWKKQEGHKGGTCRRYPPKVFIHREQGTVDYEQSQPYTQADDFCGEHRTTYRNGHQ